MVEIASIGAALGSLKTAGELAGAFLNLRDTAAVQAKVIELQSVILAAQSSALAAQGEQLALLEEKRRLEKHVAELEAWDREKQRYELKEIARGAFVYMLKSGMEDGEPPHPICANCFQDGKKTVLQRRFVEQGRRNFLDCHRCQAELNITAVGGRLG